MICASIPFGAEMSFKRFQTMVTVLLAFGCRPQMLNAQAPDSYKVMSSWMYGLPTNERVGAYGQLFKSGADQSSKLMSFEVGDPTKATRLQAGNWVEFKYLDGSSERVDYQLGIPDGARSTSNPPGGFFGDWRVDFSAKMEIVGYRIFFQDRLFAEQYFQPNPALPTIRIWEPRSGGLSWDIRGRVEPTSTSVMFSRDFAENWYGVAFQRSHGEHMFKEFNTRGAKHPLLIRVVAYQDFRRFVAYYQIGKGYVNGPEEIGAPKGRH
jgi:hypothetical protein